MSEAFEMIDGAPICNLYIGGQWTRSHNAATGEIFARVQQAGAAETTRAIDAADGAYKAWAGMVVAEREAVFLRAADVRGAKMKEIVEVPGGGVGFGRRQGRLRSRLLLPVIGPLIRSSQCAVIDGHVDDAVSLRLVSAQDAASAAVLNSMRTLR